MTSWDIDWVWSLPLIAVSVIVHVIGLLLIFRGVVNMMRIATERCRFIPMFIAVIGSAALLATLLHGLEAGLWPVAYRGLGALPDGRSAMLYSLSAMTSYGARGLAGQRNERRRAAIFRLVQVPVLAFRVRAAGDGEGNPDLPRIPADAARRNLDAVKAEMGKRMEQAEAAAKGPSN